ncbi:hypothetical protein [Desulfosporosinus metallidurans]|uniref:Uncharacterized protein n=1 Tax=Desulfosporosinus metallidurans TaxID=1888891 RepID=A0A1Q8QYQ0_9FIRM|nr:hypothetical protein [Desulfosporosinus metallidurans]OLN32463.1 hypothetical protein DSOL_1499 [Desulfosporosinus metallidurans]
MSSKVVSSKCEVETFLKEIKEILVNPYFNVSRDLDILLKKRSETAIDPYTTGNTLLALDFDMADAVHQLMALELSEYLETFIDDKDNSLPPFFAFAKSIQSKDVYIKVKIRDRQKCKVFCVSFHFAKYPFPVKLPYA